MKLKLKVMSLTACRFMLAVVAFNVRASSPPASDFRAAAKWKANWFASAKSTPPFSFTYDNARSGDFLRSWQFTSRSRRLDKAKTERTLVWTDSKTKLSVRCVVIEYDDFPAVEWTAYFKNLGSSDTPILENIQGLDFMFHRGSAGEFVLNGIKGDWTVAEGFAPYRIPLGPNAVKKFTPSNHLGKSTSGPDGWPYFNLQFNAGGILMAVGWPGQWDASFTRDAANGLRVLAGQQLTHLYLQPGEEIRTPLNVLLFWQGKDIVPAQNLWRRWYIAHNLPRVNGKTQPAVTQIQVGGSEAEIPYVERFLAAGIQPDICWRDAGAGGTTWYPSEMNPWKGVEAWLNTGTWEIDPAKYPKGFRPFSDWVHSKGMQFLLWFEPERVGSMESWLGRNHPEWVLPCNAQGGLLNEGDPAALRWLIEHIDNMIKTQGLDWYREDMNGDGPLPGWRKHDAADRQGITENHYVQGHLEFWDELRRRNPGLRLDSCASGGRRNDLETMRRAVPLTRSDFQFPDMKGVVEAAQAHTYGLSFWLPFYGNGCYFYDPYSYRSSYMPLFGMGGLDSATVEAQKKAYRECRKVGPLMLGDYYPLTDYSLALDQWIAWQFDRPEQGDGVVQAFRRAQAEAPTMTFRLRGLDPAAQYQLTDFDVTGSTKVSGKQLMSEGLTVQLPKAPGAAVISYRVAK